MACDICGKTGTILEDIKNDYKTEDIQQICSECRIKINEHFFKIRKMNRQIEESFLKEFMKNFKIKFKK